MGTMRAPQILVWPTPTCFVPTKSTAAKARRVLAVGILIVHSDVLLLVSLQSRSWECQFAVQPATRRDYSFSSAVAWLLRLSCGFISTSAGGTPIRVCSCGFLRAHQKRAQRWQQLGLREPHVRTGRVG